MVLTRVRTPTPWFPVFIWELRSRLMVALITGPGEQLVVCEIMVRARVDRNISRLDV